MTQRLENSFFRILDAVSNRAAEGLRVVEDLVRLHLEDRFLAEGFKRLRHQLAADVSRLSEVSLSEVSLTAFRDSHGDVGRTIQLDSEYQRESSESSSESPIWDSLVAANCKRAQQALRTLEELAKLVDPEVARQFEQLRYTAYSLEQSVGRLLHAAAAFTPGAICVLIDGDDWKTHCDREVDQASDAIWASSRLSQTVSNLVACGVDLIQLRDKHLSDRQLLAAGRKMTAAVRDTSTRWIMNDRVDLALRAGAHGVHVGQDELPIADVRRLAGPGKLVGVSTHTLEQAQRAQRDGADYIGVGPVFPSGTKAFDAHPGVELLQQVAQSVAVPAFAIGGIDVSNSQRVSQSGITRVAVSGAYATMMGQPIERWRALTNQLRASLLRSQAAHDQFEKSHMPIPKST